MKVILIIAFVIVFLSVWYYFRKAESIEKIMEESMERTLLIRAMKWKVFFAAIIAFVIVVLIVLAVLWSIWGGHLLL